MSIQPLTYLLVGLGSGLGASARVLSSYWLYQPAILWPWPTLLVNVLGSFFIGYYACKVNPQKDHKPAWQVSETQKQFVLAGFCGGFTTFSVFSLESLLLWMDQQWLMALSYVLASVFSWLLAVWSGHILATRLTKLLQND